MTGHTLLRSLLCHQKPATSLARPFYADPALYQTDLDMIWHASRIFAASEAELPKAGSCVTLQLGAYPVVVVRGQDGQLRAFHNVSRQRGQRLCSRASGQTAQLVRPFAHLDGHRRRGKAKLHRLRAAEAVHRCSEPANAGLAKRPANLLPCHQGVHGCRWS